MTSEEILTQLKALGQESIKKVLLKHDIREPLYGVKIEELKKIAKKIKNGHDLSLQLYSTGVYDAMYLAGLIAEPEKMSGEVLQRWAEQANAPALRQYTVAWVAAEGAHGMTKAMEWIKSDNEDLVTTGWATLSNIVSLKDDKELDMQLLTDLLRQIVPAIHNSPDRVRLAMNSFVIAVGIYVKELNGLAKQAGREIGKVTADMGDTACKVPSSLEYIDKAEKKNSIGKKKKSARCL